MIDLLDIKPKYEKRMAQTIEMKADGDLIIHPRKMTNILTCEMEEIPKETLYLKINEIIIDFYTFFITFIFLILI